MNQLLELKRNVIKDNIETGIGYGLMREGIMMCCPYSFAGFGNRIICSNTCPFFEMSKEGEKQISAVFGPTCDAFDTITLSAELPELEINDLVYAENIGAYSHASSTYFNGFPPAKVVHINK